MRHDRQTPPRRSGQDAFERPGRDPAAAASSCAQSLSADGIADGRPDRGDPRGIAAHSGEFRHRGDERPRSVAVRARRRRGRSCDPDRADRPRPGRRGAEDDAFGIQADAPQPAKDDPSRRRHDQLHPGRRAAQRARHGARPPRRKSSRLPGSRPARPALQRDPHARQPGLRAGRASGEFAPSRHLLRQPHAHRQELPRLGDRPGQGARRHRDDGDCARAVAGAAGRRSRASRRSSR